MYWPDDNVIFENLFLDNALSMIARHAGTG